MPKAMSNVNDEAALPLELSLSSISPDLFGFRVGTSDGYKREVSAAMESTTVVQLHSSCNIALKLPSSMAAWSVNATLASISAAFMPTPTTRLAANTGAAAAG